MAFVVPQIKLTPKQRQALGQEFSRRITDARTDRDERMDKVWTKALSNYEERTTERVFPWTNASNAFLSLTASHTDAWAARIRNAATAHDPAYITTAWSGAELVPETPDGPAVKAEDYAEWWQQYSKWLEKEEIPNDEVAEKVTTVMTKFGNAIVYLPWEHDFVMDVEFDNGGEPIKTERDMANKPVPHVIHPKNFYMPVSEEDIQTSPWCGFDMLFTPDQIRLKIKKGEWDKDEAEAVLRFHAELTQKERDKEGRESSRYYRMTEDGRILNTEEYEREKERALKIPRVDSTKIPLVKIFAREDTDGDGIPEEIELIIHPDSGRVPHAVWSRFKHKKRPLVMYSFVWREGTWMHLGVPEMLFNSQKVMNELIRDHLDNNKVRNTQVFIGRAGSGLSPDEPIFPSRFLMVEDIERDFKAVPMSTGVPSTSLQDLAVIQSWAERRDGITDFNLGRERSSRTPATTILALLEEGNERTQAIVRRYRRSSTEYWTQVHQLYAQNRDAEGLDRVVGAETAEKIRAVWRRMSVDDIRKKLILNSQVSTQNLNRAVKRQEMVALLGQLDAYHTRLINLAQAIRSTDDPTLRALFVAMARSGKFLMERIINTHDIKDQTDMNPDLFEVLGQVEPGPPFGGATPSGAGEQVNQALRNRPNEPLNAPGRPAAGIQRTQV